jgi:hypothetical protein
MPDIPIPPWLKSPDVAADYSRGLAIGAQVAESNARLSQEAQRTAMEAQTRAQTLKQEQLQQQTRLQTEAAYKQTQIALQKQRLDEAAKLNDAKVKSAAMKVAAQHALWGDLNATKPDGSKMFTTQEAIFRNPAASPTAAIQLQGQEGVQSRSDRQAALEADKLDFAKEKANKPKVIGHRSIPTRDPDTGNVISTTTENIYGSEPIGGAPVPPANAAPGAAASFPAAPAKEQRKAGQVYMTPKGPHTWNGKGWSVYAGQP